MKNSTIRIIVIIGALTIISLASVQFYLLKSAFNNRQNVFEHSVQVALFKVVSRLNNSELSQLPQVSPIIKESSDYYVVDVSDTFLGVAKKIDGLKVHPTKLRLRYCIVGNKKEGSRKGSPGGQAPWG